VTRWLAVWDVCSCWQRISHHCNTRHFSSLYRHRYACCTCYAWQKMTTACSPSKCLWYHLWQTVFRTFKQELLGLQTRSLLKHATG